MAIPSLAARGSAQGAGPDGGRSRQSGSEVSSGLCNSTLREAGSVFLLHSQGLDPSEPGLRLTQGECFWLRKAAPSLLSVSPWVSLVPGADGEWLPHPGNMHPWGPALGPRRRSSKHCLPSSLLVGRINGYF